MLRRFVIGMGAGAGAVVVGLGLTLSVIWLEDHLTSIQVMGFFAALIIVLGGLTCAFGFKS